MSVISYFIPGLRYLISYKLINPNWNGSQFQIHHIESSYHRMITGVKDRQNRFYDVWYKGIFVNFVTLSISDLKIKTPLLMFRFANFFSFSQFTLKQFTILPISILVS